MTQFITGPAHDRKIINIKQVSNIGFENYIDRNNQETWKIIINFAYGVSLKNEYRKQISDYQYLVFHDESEYQVYVDEFSKLINDYSWLAPRIGGAVKRIINPDMISFIATDLRKNRVIVNLASSVSFYNNVDRKTSDFLFIDFNSLNEFKLEYQYMVSKLSEREM